MVGSVPAQSVSFPFLYTREFILKKCPKTQRRFSAHFLENIKQQHKSNYIL